MFHHLYHYSPSWSCSRYRESIPCLFRKDNKCVLGTGPIAPICPLRTQVASSPLSFGVSSPSAGRTLLRLPVLFKALTISTHANSQTLTKLVPFASVFPLLEWKQVMRLVNLRNELLHNYFLRILIRVFSSILLPAFIGSDLLATTKRSVISQPIDLAFPFGLYLPYLVRVYVKGTTRLPSVIYTLYSIHPDPNHVDEPCRSYPFPVFLQDIRIRIGFPVFWAGHPTSPPPLVHRIPGWTLPAGPSDSPSRETPCQSFSCRR